MVHFVAKLALILAVSCVMAAKKDQDLKMEDYTAICSYSAETQANAPKQQVNDISDELDKTTYFSFSVKACEEARILISDMSQGPNEPHHVPGHPWYQKCTKYQIQIGAQGNTVSQIMDIRQNVALVTMTHQEQQKPLDCKKYRRFYVSWRNQTLEVGYEQSHSDKNRQVAQQPFLRYRPQQPMNAIRYIYASSKTQAQWQFDAPCPYRSSAEMRTQTVTYTQELYTKTKYLSRHVDYESEKLTLVQPPPEVSVSDLYRFCFSVSKCSDARIVLAQNPDKLEGQQLIDIVFDTHNNITIREQLNKKLPGQQNKPKSCQGYRKLYVQWKEGEVSVGKEIISPKNPRNLMDQPIFKKRLSKDIPVNYILVGGNGEKGKMYIDFKHEQKMLNYYEETREIKTSHAKKCFPVEREVQEERCAWMKKGKNTTVCYHLSERYYNYQDAESYCQSYGGHLALFNMKLDNTQLAQAIKDKYYEKFCQVYVDGAEPRKLDNYKLSQKNSTVIFSSQLDKGARVVLSQEENNWSNNVLVVIVGGHSDKKQVSVVRQDKQGDAYILAETTLNQPLSYDPHRMFWITTENNKVILGEGCFAGQNQILTVDQTQPQSSQDRVKNKQPIQPEHVFFNSPAGQRGNFYVKNCKSQQQEQQEQQDQQQSRSQQQQQQQSANQQQQQSQQGSRQQQQQNEQQQEERNQVPSMKPFWAVQGVQSQHYNDQECQSSYTVQCGSLQGRSRQCVSVRIQSPKAQPWYQSEDCSQEHRALCEIPKDRMSRYILASPSA